MKTRRKVNTKRRLRKPPNFTHDAIRLTELASNGSGIVKRSEAETLLKEGLRRGLVSVQERNGWPQNVWAAYQGRIPLEAMLDNPELGTYHGYPMLSYDPLYYEVLKRWNAQ